MEIDKYCRASWFPTRRIERFSRVLKFLSEECSGVYTDVSKKQYSYNEETGYSNISGILAERKPVIMLVNREPFLAVREIIYKRTRTTSSPWGTIQTEEYESMTCLMRGENEHHTKGTLLEELLPHYINYSY